MSIYEMTNFKFMTIFQPSDEYATISHEFCVAIPLSCNELDGNQRMEQTGKASVKNGLREISFIS